jgi:hypothetical protein
MYKDLGESLPRLPQWEDFTTSQPHIIEVLVQIYKQMLEFHFIMLNYFRQPRTQRACYRHEKWFANVVTSDRMAAAFRGDVENY